MKNEKNYMGFLFFIKNIANFEAFWRDTNFSKNLSFLGSIEVNRATNYLIILQYFPIFEHCDDDDEERELFWH